MRKRVLVPADSATAEQWLDLSTVASVEVTSEEPEHPVETALAGGPGPGWRAERPGKQTIRIVFDDPQQIRRIYLRFVEHEIERVQEFTLAWAGGHGEPLREIVRQQWNFSPNGSTTEIEDYGVDLAQVLVLELSINPDIRSPDAVATLAEWRVG